jgi:hypothetical protein
MGSSLSKNIELSKINESSLSKNIELSKINESSLSKNIELSKINESSLFKNEFDHLLIAPLLSKFSIECSSEENESYKYKWYVVKKDIEMFKEFGLDELLWDELRPNGDYCWNHFCDKTRSFTCCIYWLKHVNLVIDYCKLKVVLRRDHRFLVEMDNCPKYKI